MKIVSLVMFVIVIACPHWGHEQSNSVWDIPIARVEFRHAKLKQVITWLEKNSRRIDHEGRGYRIILPSELADNEVTVEANNISTRAVFLVMALRVCFDQNTALVLYESGSPVFLVGGIFGRCFDAGTQAPVTNVIFQSPFDSILPIHQAIASDGSFVATITYAINLGCFATNCCAELGASEAILIVSSPGYQTQTNRVPIGVLPTTTPGPLEIGLNRLGR